MGDNPVAVFRGYATEDDDALVVTIQTFGGVITDFSSRDPIVVE